MTMGATLSTTETTIMATNIGMPMTTITARAPPHA
jgi:hypothetical protein